MADITGIIIALTVMFIGAPSAIFMVMWIRSYNVVIPMFREVGDKVENAVSRNYTAKVWRKTGLGETLHFFPGSKLKDTKRYDSNMWVRVRRGKKWIDGIPLYAQGGNIRPIVLDNSNEDKPVLVVKNEDNRQFILDREMKNEVRKSEHRVVIASVFSFMAFMTIITIVVVLGYIFGGKSDLVTAIQTAAQGPILGG